MRAACGSIAVGRARASSPDASKGSGGPRPPSGLPPRRTKAGRNTPNELLLSVLPLTSWRAPPCAPEPKVRTRDTRTEPIDLTGTGA